MAEFHSKIKTIEWVDNYSKWWIRQYYPNTLNM